MDNLIVVSGQYGASNCMDKDAVAVKDKIRSKRLHDTDKFREKDHAGKYGR